MTRDLFLHLINTFSHRPTFVTDKYDSFRQSDISYRINLYSYQKSDWAKGGVEFNQQSHFIAWIW